MTKEGQVIDAPQVSHDAQLMRVANTISTVQTVEMAKARLAELQAFVGEYLTESQNGGEDGGDYGVLPGTKKKTLYKSGAEKLCDIYGLSDTYIITSKTEDWETGLFDYVIECRLENRTSTVFVGSGLGSCSTWESRYRYRQANRKCPSCHKEAIIVGKPEYGGGFICFKKKGGCGTKYSENDPTILGQAVGRVENEDLADHKNTVLKMAQKRAKLAAVIAATRSSGLFTQDIDPPADDERGPVSHQATRPTTQASQPPKPVAAKPVEKPMEKPAEKPAERPGPRPVPPPESRQTQTPTAAEKPQASGPAPVQVAALDPQKTKDGDVYVVRFTARVAAEDGSMVAGGFTKAESLAVDLDNAKTNRRWLIPRVVAVPDRRGVFEVVSVQFVEPSNA